MESKKELKDMWDAMLKDCDTYVMCSTLNQIVNYLPLKKIAGMHDRKNFCVRNITYKDGESSDKDLKPRFSNKEWDENIRAVAGKYISGVTINPNDNIYLNRNFDLKSYLDTLERAICESKSKFFLWNLTGGQRNVLFAVQHFIELDCVKGSRKHMIFYLEGNTQRIIVGCYVGGHWDYAEMNDVYEDSQLTISQVFALAGFDATAGEEYFFDTEKWKVKGNIQQSGKNSNAVDHHKKIEDRNEAYTHFFQIYKENEKDLISKMVQTNCVERGKQWSRLEEIIDGITALDNNYKACIKNSLNHEGSMPFGYFLEYMTQAVLLDEIKNGKWETYGNRFQSLSFNVSVKNKNKKDAFCQLDLVLLLKSGQIVCFECKSGNMESDNGKAREYTAYVLGGVYGKPVLITPLRNSDFCCDAQKLEYKNIIRAINAANRAGLDICWLDCLAEDIKKIFEPLFGVCNAVGGGKNEQ